MELAHCLSLFPPHGAKARKGSLVETAPQPKSNDSGFWESAFGHNLAFFWFGQSGHARDPKKKKKKKDNPEMKARRRKHKVL